MRKFHAVVIVRGGSTEKWISARDVREAAEEVRIYHGLGGPSPHTGFLIEEAYWTPEEAER